MDRPGPALGDGLAPKIWSAWREVNILTGLVVLLNWVQRCGPVRAGTNRPTSTGQRGGGTVQSYP